MKKFYILLVALFLVNGAMGQWFPQNSGTTKNLFSVHFTDANTGYAVGDSGIILKTTNGGTNWTPQNSGATRCLASVYFPSNDTGYAVGSDTIIYKTTDGGITWTSRPFSKGWYFSSVFFTNVDTGYVVGGHTYYIPPSSYAAILKTVDGGTNWSNWYEYSYNWSVFSSVYFTDANTGYVVGSAPYGMGSTILKTVDAGLSWSINPIGGIIPKSVYFPATDLGYIVGSDNLQGTGEYNLGKTTNGDGNWTFQNIGISDTLTSVYFTDTEKGYVVSQSGIIRKTQNGGTDWTIQYSDSAIRLSSVYFVDENIGYVVGNSGTILKTTNGGYVGINDKHQTVNTPTICPNPANDKITVETPAKGNLSIHSINGQQLLQQEITEPTTTINVNTLPSGVYFVRVTSDKNVQVGKFIKQ